MSDRRQTGGFRRAGTCPPERLGVSERRAAELRLAAAWRACAGPALAGHATAVNVRRGVLEVVLTDAGWAATVAELLPRLAGRIAHRHPRLGVRRCRLTVEAEGVMHRSETFELSDVTGDLPARPETIDRGAPSADPPVADGSAERLGRLAERYLDRAATKNGQNP
jgi:hypothetical protein